MGNEVIINQETIARAVASVTRALEPRINEFATLAANRVVNEGQRVARSLYYRVREQPWYLVGAAAALLVLAAVFLRVGNDPREESAEMEPTQHLH